MGAFWNFILQLHAFAGPAAMLVYPLYASVVAIESPNKEDDVQWLTYWVLYSFVTLTELAIGSALAWIPIWPTLKLVAACWLVLPQFKGAAYVYDHYVRHHPLKNQLISSTGRTTGVSSQNLSPESKSLASKYIAENGQDAFDRLIRGALKDSPKHTRGPVYDY